MDVKQRIEDLNPRLKELIELSKTKICLPYQANEDKLRKIAKELNFKPVLTDKMRVCRVHVDEQTCFNWPYTYMNQAGEIRYICFIESKDSFVFPFSMEKRIDWIKRNDFDPLSYDQVWAGQLSVPNSWNDTLRIIECDVINMYRTTKHVLSADKHPSLSVTNRYNYSAARNSTYGGIYYKLGETPSVFTVITANNMFHPQHNPSGMWIPQYDVDKAWDYINRLTKSQITVDPVDVLPLTLWPAHATQETWGSTIDPLIWEVVQLHSYSRNTGWHLIEKGQSPSTEFHGAYEAEVAFKDDLNSQAKISELAMFEDFDLLVYSGQAAGNCFRRTIEQQYNYLLKFDPESINKMIVLSDTTSSIPGTEDGYYRSLESMKKHGLRVMTTDEYTQELDRIEAVF